MAIPISKVTLTIDNKNYIFGIQQAEKETKQFGDQAAASFNKADQASNKLALNTQRLNDGFGKLRGALAGVAIGAFAANALQSADAVADLADSTQMSIGKILEFQKALQLAGGDANDTGKALATFYGSIDEANQGSDKTIETFKRLGVSFRDLKTLSEEDLLDKTIKGFANITDPIQRSTTLTNLFGKAMRTVEPGRLGEELENLRGTLGAQEGSVTAAADAIEQFEGLVNALKGAVVLAIKPFLEFFGQFKDGEYDVRAMAGTIQSLAAAYVALRVAAFGAAIAQSAVGGGLKGGAAGLATGLAAAALTYKGLQELMDKAGAGPQPGTQGPLAGIGPNSTIEEALAEERRLRERRNRDTERRNREQQIGKELQGQLTAVNQLVGGYRSAAQANMDRYTTEVNLLGLSQEQQDLIRGTAQIEARYASQIAALEDKKTGAKGETLKLIQKSIEEVKGLQTSEQDIFEITQQQIFNYKQQQEEIKRVTDEIDKQIERQGALNTVIRDVNKEINRSRETITANQTSGLTSIQKQILEIQQSVRRAGQDAASTFAEGFNSEDGLTPERAAELAKGLEAIQKSYGLLTQTQIDSATAGYEQSRSFENGWKSAYASYVESATNAATIAGDIFNSVTGNMNSAIDNFVMTGKFKFKDFAASVIQDILKIQLRASAAQLLGNIPGIGAFFSVPGRAMGGPVSANSPYIIGERGPELFVPQSSGTVVPNNRLGGGNTIINNITAIDAKGVAQLFAENRQVLFGNVEQARRELPMRMR